MNAQELAKEISNYLNQGKSKEDLCLILAQDHRFLQNEFSILCFRWIEQLAIQYKNKDYDGRNEGGVIRGKILNDFFNSQDCDIKIQELKN